MDGLYGVTREDWQAYERLRQSGITNMFFRDVQDMLGITEPQHLAILGHYAEMAAAWKEAH